MMEALRLSALVAANLWAAGSLDSIFNTEQGAVTSYTLGGLLGVADGPRHFLAGAAIGGAAGAAVGDAVGAEMEAQDNRRQARAIAAANAQALRQMTLKEIVEMARVGIPAAIIIRQIEGTHSVFNLVPDDVKFLRDQKVSADVIEAMLAHSNPPPTDNENDQRTPIPAELPTDARRTTADLPTPRELIGKRVVLETRTESGPPILSDIPYLSRLFRTVGWSRESVQILPPIKPGECPKCGDGPRQAEILRVLPAGVFGKGADDVEFTVEKLVDRVDPPRFFPLIGPAQFHHCHWKCTVHFTDSENKRREEVVYIDKDRLHLVYTEQDAAQRDAAAAAVAAELTADQPKQCPYCPGGHTGPAKGATPGDPNSRMEQMLIDTENLRQMHDEWRRFFATEEERARRVAPADLLVINGIQVGSKKAITAAECSIICGDHLIRPDGTISLGTFGSANVAGLTLDQVKSVIEDHLKPYFAEPRVAVALKTERGPIVPVGATEESAAPPRSPQVAQALPQVQLEILVAEVPSNAFRDAGLRWSEARTGLIDNGARFGVTEKPNALLCSLQVMFSNGTAKQVAQPRLTTLSGQWAYFASGGKTPVTTSDGVTSTPFDTVVQFRPIVQGDGRIHLDIEHEASPKESSLEHTNSASADVSDGHTLVFVLHGAGSGSDKEKQDFVILVTPHVVHPVSSSETTPSKQMTFADIVRLSKRGIREDIIIRQMELTESVFTLTVEDILSLNEQGVSDNLIRAMQNRVQSR